MPEENEKALDWRVPGVHKDTSPMVRSQRIKRKIRIQEINTPASSLFDTKVDYPSDQLPEWFQGIAEIGHYFEVVYTTPDLPDSFKLSIFPAFRILFRSGTYTVARCYLGASLYTDEQWEVIYKAHADEDIIDYTRIYPKGWGESNA